MDIKWKCPKCEAKNVDVYELTTFPMCGECGETSWWDELLTAYQMWKANKALKKALKKEAERP